MCLAGMRRIHMVPERLTFGSNEIYLFVGNCDCCKKTYVAETF